MVLKIFSEFYLIRITCASLKHDLISFVILDFELAAVDVFSNILAKLCCHAFVMLF